MYGPVKRHETESLPVYVSRVKGTKRNSKLRVTSVRPLTKGEDHEEAMANITPNELRGIDKPPCHSKNSVVKYITYIFVELDVIIFLVAITCDMPQRDNTLCRGGTTRSVGCAWFMLEGRYSLKQSSNLLTSITYSRHFRLNVLYMPPNYQLLCVRVSP